MKPFRKVVGSRAMQCNSIGNNQLQMQWWDLTLECGHEVERRLRFPPQVGFRSRGFASLHHPRRQSEALPPPRRCRCSYCPAEVST